MQDDLFWNLMRNTGTRNQWYENITKTEDKCSKRAVILQESIDPCLDPCLATNLSWPLCTAWWSFSIQDILSSHPSLNPTLYSQHPKLDSSSSKNKTMKNKVLQLPTFSTVMKSNLSALPPWSALFFRAQRTRRPSPVHCGSWCYPLPLP